METRTIRIAMLALAALCLPLVCVAQEAPQVKEIKVLRVGSSSFGYELIEQTRAIMEALGDYRLVCDAKEDGAGVRLDRFVRYPGLSELWCEETLPRIEAGDYDYVIIQTIGWLNFTPEQQDLLCTEIIPDLAERIRGAGARVILYDKYLRPLRDQENPKARTWCGRYPEGYRLSYLLHIMAAKHAGIEKISFGGEAVTALWDVPRFARLPVFLHDGHPSSWAHHITAINLAYLLTGEDPVGNPVRELPLAGMRLRGFERLGGSDRAGDREIYEDVKAQVKGDRLVLTDEEARILQETAMESQRRWGALLKKNLESDEAFAETMKEIRRIQGEMGKYEEYGLDEGRIAALKQQYAAPEEEGELKPALLEKIRGKSRSINYTRVAVRKYTRNFFPREEQKEIQKEYRSYWDEHHKLRDDIFFECRVEQEKALRRGDHERAAALGSTCNMISYVFSLPAYRILLERASEEQKKTILENYDVHGGDGRNSPAFRDYQNKHHLDEEKLLEAWEIYLDIWKDADLMDKLRDEGVEVFKEADREFERRISQ